MGLVQRAALPAAVRLAGRRGAMLLMVRSYQAATTTVHSPPRQRPIYTNFSLYKGKAAASFRVRALSRRVHCPHVPCMHACTTACPAPQRRMTQHALSWHADLPAEPPGAGGHHRDLRHWAAHEGSVPRPQQRPRVGPFTCSLAIIACQKTWPLIARCPSASRNAKGWACQGER